MAKPTISGNGPNSRTHLQNIHSGKRSFRRDLSTRHDQIARIQEALCALGHDPRGADGIYGDRTRAAVRAFQRAQGLQVDGLFGKKSLERLERLLGRHLDPDPGGCVAPEPTAADSGAGDAPLSVARFLENLERYCNAGWTYCGCGYSLSKKQVDCANYPYLARNRRGGQGCTTEYTRYLAQKGTIEALGGYDGLEVGMEVFQPDGKDPRKKGHMGVYAGKRVINGRLQHAVYQSCSGHRTIDARYNDGNPKDSGPNLTGMNDKWTDWGWSKFVAPGAKTEAGGRGTTEREEHADLSGL